MSSPCKCSGRLFQTHGPAAAKLLLPNVLCVCVWNNARSVGGRTEPTSRTFLQRMYAYTGTVSDLSVDGCVIITVVNEMHSD